MCSRVVVMPPRPDPTEAVARVVTMRVVSRFMLPGEDVAGLVDRLWPATAAELRAGIIDENGNVLTKRFRERGTPAGRDGPIAAE
jgi:hypothetical protein